MIADAVCKAKLLNDFGFFTRYFFKAQYSRRFQVAEHHHQIFEALYRVVSGQSLRLIINIPPRYGKTEIAVKMFVAWCLANSPAAMFIHLSCSDDLALDNSSAIRDVVKSAEYQRVFPMPLRGWDFASMTTGDYTADPKMITVPEQLGKTGPTTFSKPPDFADHAAARDWIAARSKA